MDKIVLTRDGVVENLAKATVGNNISRILTIYGAITIGLFYFGFKAYKNGQTLHRFYLGFI